MTSIKFVLFRWVSWKGMGIR